MMPREDEEVVLVRLGKKEKVTVVGMQKARGGRG